MFLVGNGGYVVSKGLGSEGANIGTLAQGLASLLGGVGAGALGWYKKGSAPKSSTFDDDMNSISQLAKSCGGCSEVQEALEVIQKAALRKQMPPRPVAPGAVIPRTENNA